MIGVLAMDTILILPAIKRTHHFWNNDRYSVYIDQLKCHMEDKFSYFCNLKKEKFLDKIISSGKTQTAASTQQFPTVRCIYSRPI